MSRENLQRASSGETDASTAHRRIRIDGLPYFGATEEVPMFFDVPFGLDVEAACAEWVTTGGQVRIFGAGTGTEMSMKSYQIADWLITQKGARRVYEASQPATAQ